MADQNDLTIDYIKAKLISIDYGSIVITILWWEKSLKLTRTKKAIRFTEKNLKKNV